ncbi:hypothetical protein Noda2021_12530 [Candidatus Dependentiae bacterium Noda2021]|nr:hypothetical protein Noda2021_12530 [Candidatus Dependentiae bacterium Noda2021]
MKLLFLISLLVLPVLATEKPTPFTQEDFKKITFKCDIILQHMGLLKSRIQELEKEIQSKTTQSASLLPLVLKIHEMDFLVNYLMYNEKCLKK